MGLKSVLRGVGNVLEHVGERAPIAQAYLAGDYAAAGRLGGQVDERRTDRRELKRKKQVRSAAFTYLTQERGWSPARAAVMAENLGKLSEELNTSERTREMSEGESLASPRRGGGYDLTTAPKIVQHGADFARIDSNDLPEPGPMLPGSGGPMPLSPQGGAGLPEQSFMMGTRGRQFTLPPPEGSMPPQGFGGPPPGLPMIGQGGPPMLPGSYPGQARGGSRVWSMRTEAEQSADAAGIVQGHPDRGRFLRDYFLKAQGPTAVGMNEADNATSRRNVDVQTGTSRDNNIRSTEAVTGNNLRSNAQSRENSIRGAETTRGSAGYRGKGGRTAKPRARNAAGVEIEWNGKAWVPVR